MSVTRREMVKRLGFGGTAAGLSLLAGRGFADETDGDPAYAGFARNIRVIDPSLQDVPSARLEGGKVIQPARE
ncbi:MAG TPA: hypothetical protein PLW27_03555, partial [Kiritimatiellia bacterium]|nr:hypothetical protein [Kiritimatiellia bacterium]